MHRERGLFFLSVLPIFFDSIIAENVTTFIFDILQLMTNYLRSDHAESDSVSAISQIEKYSFLASKQDQILFGGRLGQYRYYDMDKVIESALEMVAEQSGVE